MTDDAMTEAVYARKMEDLVRQKATFEEIQANPGASKYVSVMSSERRAELAGQSIQITEDAMYKLALAYAPIRIAKALEKLADREFTRA